MGTWTMIQPTVTGSTTTRPWHVKVADYAVGMMDHGSGQMLCSGAFLISPLWIPIIFFNVFREVGLYLQSIGDLDDDLDIWSYDLK